MARVDPFVVQWPIQWMNDPEIRPVIEYLNRFLHDLYLRTGGGVDAIAELETRETYIWGGSQVVNDSQYSNAITNTSALSNQNKIIKDINFRTVSTTSNYTAVDRDWVNASSGAEISLPQYPEDNSAIIIRNVDGSRVLLNGNGKNINGKNKDYITKKYTAIRAQYSVDLDEWGLV